MHRLLCAAAVLLMPTVASAGSIFLNGVNIDGVVNQEFKNCTVRVDATGNVFITAAGYAVGGKPGAAAAPAPEAAAPSGGPPTKKVFLVTEKAAPGMSQYDIDLFINSKWVRKLLDDEEHIVFELTKYLVTGPNKIQFVSKKNLGSARRSQSPQHYFRVIIGEGDSGGRNIMINKKFIDYKRTAFETQDFNDVQTITVQ